MATKQIATIDNTPQAEEAEKFSLMQRQAALFSSSPLIPQHLRNGSAQQAMANCYIAMTIADRMGEDRMTVMQNIHIVHGTAGFKTEYKIARANQSGVFSEDIDWEIDKSDKNNLSVTAFATLAKSKRRVEVTVDMAMAKAEGWTKNSKYQTMPEIMLRYRSASFLIRLYAPQVMLGYQSVDEIEDVAFAAVPVNEPLSGQALLDQARTDDPPAQAEAETGPDAAATSDFAEGPDDTQRGEAFNGAGDEDLTAPQAHATLIPPTLDEAKDALKACKSAGDVNTELGKLRQHFSGEDLDELNFYGAEVIDALIKKAAK